jgi:hypothetical protein
VSSPLHLYSGGTDNVVNVWDLTQSSDLEDELDQNHPSCLEILHNPPNSPPLSPRSSKNSAISKMLTCMGLEKYVDVFEANDIDLPSFYLLTNEDLREVINLFLQWF